MPSQTMVSNMAAAVSLASGEYEQALAMLDAYRAGVLYGLWSYAYWDDGTQLVGSCGTTLEKAQAEVEEAYEHVKASI